jgi:hypothetical protein
MSTMKLNKGSFITGFVRGLKSPFFLFYVPEPHTVDSVEHVLPALMRDGDPLTGDWKAVGIDLWNSVEKYGKEHAS